ncbi:hypothetical protein LUZ60_003321 [Juncus effusus]|nr:hypothetical protein LUZ60_003321 [Juncus effusus]
MAMELQFFDTFERQYGTHHPFFYACRFTEALKIASSESKFLFLYLHSTENTDNFTESFCKLTLCSELVVQFLDSNFVSWGAIENKGEGLDLVSTLKVETFPFCAVVAPVNGDNFVVLQQIEGPVSPQELVEILQRTLDEHGSAFNVVRSEEERRRRAEEERRRTENRQLREEQDAAYLETLRKDQEKELRQKRIVEKTTQKKQMGSVTKQNTKSKNANLTNSSQRTDSITKIMIRLPDGERRPHTFHPTDKIWSIFNYIESLDIPEIGNYKIVANFPKRIYGFEQLEMSLKDAGFHPSATLYLEKFT